MVNSLAIQNDIVAFDTTQSDIIFIPLTDGATIADTTSTPVVKVVNSDKTDKTSVNGAWIDKTVKINSSSLIGIGDGTYTINIIINGITFPDSGGLSMTIYSSRGAITSMLSESDFDFSFVQNGASQSSSTSASNRSNSVKLYGAKGDGLTDDTLAIQKALDSVPIIGGSVYFPAGTYLVSQQKLRNDDTYAALFPNENTALVGDGTSSIILLADGTTKTDVIYAENKPNLSFENLVIDAGPRLVPYWTTALQLNTTDNLFIKNITIRNGNIEGLYLFNSTSFVIDGLHTYNNGTWRNDASGLHIDSDHNGVISNVVSHNNGFHGVIISSSWEITLSNITSHHNGWQGLHIQTGSNKVQVTNGSFTNNSRGIYIRDWGTDNNLFSNIVVANNTYDGILTYVTYNNLISGLHAFGNGEYGVETSVNDDTIFIYSSLIKDNTLGDTHKVDNSHIYINGIEV